MRTAEFVTPSHPDKMCDRISDAIVDLALSIDPNARCAIETLGGHGRVYIVGELTMTGTIHREDIEKIVTRITGKDKLTIQTNIVQQSPEIAQGVDVGGAGDQGIMRGYAVRETPSLMPLEYDRARSLCQYLYSKHPYDGKTQITLNAEGKIHTIVASFQNVSAGDLRYDIQGWLDVSPLDAVDQGFVVHANPAGDWSIGGFDADTGLTGRKLAVDNYGPSYPIGGGAFSGKDATKVDRSGAYMARKIAVDYLRRFERVNADRVEVELAYAIGVAEPVEAIVRVDGVPYNLLEEKQYDLTPQGIIKALDLRLPQFEMTAMWGHFGNGFYWDA